MSALGLVVGGPLRDLPALATRAEEAGFGTLWVHEAAHDAVVAASVIATATRRVRIGTDVIVALARTPTLAAFSAWDLQELSDGRFVLGLGSQVRRIVEEGFSASFEPPAPRMSEYVQTVRATLHSLQGEKTPFQGRYYHVTMPAPYALPDPDRPRPPIHLAAVGPIMTRVAAAHADGLVGHPFTTPAFIQDVLVPRIDASLQDAGRSRSDFEVTSGLITEVDDDRETARRRARRQVAFYGTTPNYRTVFGANGEPELTDRCRETMRNTGFDGLHEAIPDQVLDRYAAAGTADEVIERLDGWAGLVDHLILTPPSSGRDASEVTAATRRIIDAVRASRATT